MKKKMMEYFRRKHNAHLLVMRNIFMHFNTSAFRKRINVRQMLDYDLFLI